MVSVCPVFADLGNSAAFLRALTDAGATPCFEEGRKWPLKGDELEAADATKADRKDCYAAKADFDPDFLICSSRPLYQSSHFGNIRLDGLLLQVMWTFQ